jgi:hypothetical protein
MSPTAALAPTPVAKDQYDLIWDRVIGSHPGLMGDVPPIQRSIIRLMMIEAKYEGHKQGVLDFKQALIESKP